VKWIIQKFFRPLLGHGPISQMGPMLQHPQHLPLIQHCTRNLIDYAGWGKTTPPVFVHIFANNWPIFTIFRWQFFLENLQ